VGRIILYVSAQLSFGFEQAVPATNIAEAREVIGDS
jgi:hypothetical protein